MKKSTLLSALTVAAMAANPDQIEPRYFPRSESFIHQTELTKKQILARKRTKAARKARRMHNKQR